MIKNEKIMVTGAMGFIGNNLFRRLESSNNVIGIDKLASNNPKIHQIDLVNYENVSTIINDFSPSIIFHLGTNSAGYYGDNFLEAYDEDSRSLMNILYNIKLNSDIRLIFMSSSYVYSGIDSSNIVQENMNLSPSHNFGISKYFFEKLIKRNCKEYVIYRLSNVLGFKNQINKTAVTDWLAEAQKDNDIIIWGKGKRKLQYIDMEDLLQIITYKSNFSKGIYNLGSENYHSMKFVSTKIASMSNSKVIFLEDKPEGFSLPFMNISKLQKIINYKYIDLDITLSNLYQEMNGNHG